jgi:hypothetical protein
MATTPTSLSVKESFQLASPVCVYVCRFFLVDGGGFRRRKNNTTTTNNKKPFGTSV